MIEKLILLSIAMALLTGAIDIGQLLDKHIKLTQEPYTRSYKWMRTPF